MRVNLATFKHLLPTGRAWSLTVEKRLRQFFTGLVAPFADAQDYQDTTYNDVRPQYTTKLSEWEFQFGIFTSAATEQARRDRLAAAWRAIGGQSPRYLQDTVQAAGFPLYIHEWWQPGTNPPVARIPQNFIVPDGGSTGFGVMLGGDGVQLGRDSTQLGRGRRLGILIEDNLPATPAWPPSEAQRPYFLYFGGVMFGELVQVPAAREAELRTLLLKIAPAQQWIGLFVEFV